jgi:hypothetical protein
MPVGVYMQQENALRDDMHKKVLKYTVKTYTHAINNFLFRMNLFMHLRAMFHMNESVCFYY